jgi:hypothetical protein
VQRPGQLGLRDAVVGMGFGAALLHQRDGALGLGLADSAYFASCARSGRSVTSAVSAAPEFSRTARTS